MLAVNATESGNKSSPHALCWEEGYPLKLVRKLTGRLVRPAQFGSPCRGAYARMPAMRGTGVELLWSWFTLIPVTAGFQGFLGHNDEARCVGRIHDGHSIRFLNDYSHFRFTPFIHPTGFTNAIALGYYREHFHACDNVLCGASHFIPLVKLGERLALRVAHIQRV